MRLEKNQEIVLKIDDLGNNGEGIGHVDGYALFVKDALPGELVCASIMKCRKNFGFARLIEVLEPDQVKVTTDLGEKTDAVGRVEPRCPVARQCGGCTLQHLSYEKQLLYKQKKVRDCLERIGGLIDSQENTIEWRPILAMDDPQTPPWHYRNKAQFPVRMQQDEQGNMRPAVGFYASHSHQLIPVVDCAIQHESMEEILSTTIQWMKDCSISAYNEEHHSGLVRHIYIRRGYHTGEIMVCLVINGPQLRQDPTEKLVAIMSKIPGVSSISLNINMEKTNVILGDKMIWLWGNEYIEDTIGSIRYRISPQSFFQVNPVQTEKLYETALEFADLTGGETVWDLYCGIGTISLFLAKKAAKVYGVEIVPEAVENARENAKINDIDNVEFYCGAVEQVVPEMMISSEKSTKSIENESGVSTSSADVVVVDPPRKGCDGVLLDTIVKMAPKRVVYISCDPATLARDVKILGESGYVVRKVQACDMFPMGGHVESVVLMTRV